VNRFEYVNVFDSFDGRHPKALIPRGHGRHEFRSIEDVNDYPLRHRTVRDHIRAKGRGGRIIPVMFDPTTEAQAKELGCRIALPPAKLRMRLDSEIVTTELGNDAGIASAPNALGRAPRRRGRRARLVPHRRVPGGALGVGRARAPAPSAATVTTGRVRSPRPVAGGRGS
jgi:hypothetical protein